VTIKPIQMSRKQSTNSCIIYLYLYLSRAGVLINQTTNAIDIKRKTQDYFDKTSFEIFTTSAETIFVF